MPPTTNNLAQPKFLPMTQREMNALGWAELDILLISGDAYVDHPSFGVALLGRWLPFALPAADTTWPSTKSSSTFAA